MKKSAKIALGVAGILVILAVVGTGVWLAMSADRADEVTAEVERPLEDGPLATNNALVERLYGQFEISPLQGFYGDILLDGRLGEYTREEGQLEMALNQAESLSGEAVRAKYREMFGEEVELMEEKYGASAEKMRLARGMKFVVYDAGRDEFVEQEGGTDVSGRYLRRLERAEKVTLAEADDVTRDVIYLYERVLATSCKPNPKFDESGNLISSGSFCGILTVAATCGTPDLYWEGEDDSEMDLEEIFAEAKEKDLGLVKWMFEKNAEGNYVFKDLEEVFGGGEDAD